MTDLTDIQDSLGGRWERAESPRIEFSLFDNTAERATRLRGGATAVFPLRGAPGWCSWFEAWLVEPSGRRFQLESASLTVFVGERYGHKQQILRAEWDRVRDPTGTGQPHWHVDSELSVFVEPIGAAPIGESTTLNTDDGLQRLPDSAGIESLSTTVSLMKIDAFHLAMNLRWADPPVWRHTWSENLDELPTWTSSSLVYVRDELLRFGLESASE